MIKIDELKGFIAKKNLSQARVAEMLGITPKTFYSRMKKGVFGSNEIEILIKELDIKNPMEIFFAKE